MVWPLRPTCFNIKLAKMLGKELLSHRLPFLGYCPITVNSRAVAAGAPTNSTRGPSDALE